MSGREALEEPRSGSAALRETMRALRPDAATASVAHRLASRGIPVFPCAPDGKRPLTRRGFLDASAHLPQVDHWWRRQPHANLGVPTGHASGIVVVDVDVHGPVNGYDAMRRASDAGLIDGWLFLVATPSGGTHAYYPTTPGVEQRSWQVARAGVDFRGDGGYIVLPPSSVIVGGERSTYQLRHAGRGVGTPIDAARLRVFLDPRTSTLRPSARDAALRGPADVARLAAWVANRQEGERNQGLFWAACRLAEKGVAPTAALDALTDAAGHAGLEAREIVTTVRSAYRTVHHHPGASSRAEGTAGDFPRVSRGNSSTPVRGLV